MQTIKLIPLGDISTLSNYRDVATPSEKDPDIIELSNSIAKDGVMQAILVRPDPKKKDKYQVIFGHRRLLASRIAKLATIPASIKDVADGDILEYQVTENMQRKDVHPMDEAVAFQALQQKRKWSASELATRFAKSEDYVLHRLKLNDLIPDLQKDFKNNQMLLGHALLLCKLTPDDQKAAKQYATGKNFSNETVASVKEWIEEKVIHDLSKAKFDLDDTMLFPQAGACIACSKRSGAGNLLFKDLAAKDDRCFDPHCFGIKWNKWFITELKATIETKPEVQICAGADYNGKIDQDINNFLQSMKVKPLKEYVDYRTFDYDFSFQKKARGLLINGDEKGKLITIYLKGKSSKSNADTGTGEEKINPSEVIDGIKQRTARAAQLDDEKVHSRIIDAMEAHPYMKNPVDTLKNMPEADTVAMAMIVFYTLDYRDKESIIKKIGIKGYHGADNEKKSAEFYLSLRELSAADLTLMVRQVIMRNYHGTTKRSIHGYIFRRIADSIGINIELFEKEQLEVRTKREARAAERIAALQPKKKALVKKVTAGKGSSIPKKKTDKKKAA